MKDEQPGFRVLEHTADIGFEAWAASLGDLFREAAHAFAFIAFDVTNVAGEAEWPVHVTGVDLPALLVNFLDELLYLFDTSTFAPRDVTIEAIDAEHVHARLVGEPRDPGRHSWKLIVKAVTYHGLEVTRDDAGWRARVFLDV
jgi:SHS2 domain-containing protein